MTPETLRALADTVAWQDRTDLYDAIMGAADGLERMEASIRSFVDGHPVILEDDEGEGRLYRPDSASCTCDKCQEAHAILRHLAKERGNL